MASGNMRFIVNAAITGTALAQTTLLKFGSVGGHRTNGFWAENYPEGFHN
ncbi:MAG TPA: hypothetical protein VIX14_15965 [Terriglobales bacterium]